MKIGFIGPGRMGRPMLGRLVAAGHDVSVLVRRPQARAAAEADGLPWAGTVAATVRDADAVFVVVLTDEQVRSVCLGPDGAIVAMKPGATLIQQPRLLVARTTSPRAGSRYGWAAMKPFWRRCVRCSIRTPRRSCSSGRPATGSGSSS